MKSPGGSGAAPAQPTPAGIQVPYGQTAPIQPSYTSFLPSDPTAMATGLTPEMLASINAPPPAPVMQPTQGLPPDWRDQLAKMMAGNQPRPPVQQFGAYTGPSGLMGYNYRGGANRSGGGGPGGGYGSSGGGGYSTSSRGGSSSSAGYGGGMGGRKR
jgi:hypothetical protein